MSLYDRVPVNKTAALVTSQSGCASDGTLNKEQQKVNLVAHVKQLDMQIANAPKGSNERKLLGLKKFDICTKIKELKLKPSGKRMFLSDFIIQLARDELSDFQWNRIVKKAEEMLLKINS